MTLMTARSVWLAGVLIQVLVASYFLVRWQGVERLLAVVWLLAAVIQGVAAWRQRPSA